MRSLRPIAPSDGYSPRSSVTQRPRKNASVQICHEPLRMVTDDARSLNPEPAKSETELVAVKRRPLKPSFS
jgi:hypothetical protein